MGFDKTEAEQLLVDCGRRCCICGRLHRVQVHHIVSGDDDIDNGIPLCPNCHDEAHTEYSRGRTTRTYTPEELKRHRKRTIDQVKREAKWKPGGAEWQKDKNLIAFFAQCLDRTVKPAEFPRFFQGSLCGEIREFCLTENSTQYRVLEDERRHADSESRGKGLCR